MTTNLGSHALPSLYDSDTSADELSLDFRPPAPPNQPTAVLDLAENDSPEAKTLSEKAQQARKKRLSTLEKVYESQRDLIGIPDYMTNPVGELRRIGRGVGDMLLQLKNTSVDYYKHQDTWTLRQSVDMFQEETEASLKILEKFETPQKDKVEKDPMLQSSTMEQVAAGWQHLVKERKNLVDQLSSLNRRIQSHVLDAEIERKRRYLIFELQNLQCVTSKTFDIGLERAFKSLGNLANDVKFADVVKPLLSTHVQLQGSNIRNPAYLPCTRSSCSTDT
ncbi:hypothetical protein IL306_012537 [Fusarium sp. DS 682]|nr:hypothetical protein IL306_012537 [Fusarium sp. DS 682]